MQADWGLLSEARRARRFDTWPPLILAGGLAYTAGAIVYAAKRPNPFPLTFGYHEIFHLFVILGSIFHFIAVALAVAALAGPALAQVPPTPPPEPPLAPEPTATAVLTGFGLVTWQWREADRRRDEADGAGQDL